MTTPRVSDLFQELDHGARAITASRRLARQVAQRYAESKTSDGAEAWPTPHIRVLDDWLLEIWQRALAHRSDAPRLLSDEQELMLWEQVIGGHGSAGGGRVLMQLSGTARAARRTWRRLHEWRLDQGRLRDYRSADTEAFLAWADAVRHTLDERRWLTHAELPAYLAGHTDAWLIAEDKPIWWLGFDALPPAYEVLIEQLTNHGILQHQFGSAGLRGDGPVVSECNDVEEQWHRIARWARAELRENPDQCLGVVCPDLGRHRDRIEEILDDVMQPESAWRTDAAGSFHLSLGRTLPDYAVVNVALDLLRWTLRQVPFDVLSRVLRSPYLGGAEAEWEARARFEVDLRKQQQETFSLDRLGVLVRRRTGLEYFESLLNEAARIELPDHADPGGWASRFTDWLRSFGWPGDRPQNSHEFQAVAAWREQLSRFAALGAVQQRWTLEEALKKLASLAAMRVLQFHDDQAPLQVMGASEAPGLWFDKLWLADMSDAVWPPPPQPDPFIPVPLQRACGMPDASAQAVLEHTRRRTANLLAAAGEIYASFAARDEEAPAALSPLIIPRHAERVPAGDDDYRGRVAQLQDGHPPVERIDDRRAPPLSGDAQHGGVGLVADQARCPFQALAHHRLWARALPEATPGLSAGERGKLVHAVARVLWERLESQAVLKTMDEAARRELVERCVAEVLERRFADSRFQRRLLDIEKRRLAALFMEWLALEAGRDDFRVAATELNTRLVLSGVEFKLRVDRVDELADGRRLVLDYKTGGQLAHIKSWIDPRMEEPQLPMYVLSVGEEVDAMALGSVRPGECTLRGVGDGVALLKPVSELDHPDMETLRSWWSTILGRLVDEHRRGVADVDPKSPKNCRLCDAMSLCRVFEPAGSADA